MIFETVRVEGLAHFAYIIGDEDSGVCAVIDPRRDVDVYLQIAQQHGVRISHVLETHIHADFVSGSCELAKRTGAPIFVGAKGDYGFEHCALHEGDVIELGVITLKVLHTPGHTPEHICFLVSGGAGAEQPWGLFTGDTLFAGEIGRPDLLGKDQEEALAQQLFDSLQEKLLPLGDEIVIYPAHGEGSPCGVSIGARRLSTLGYEQNNNPLLQVHDREEFVKQVLSALSPAPAYYSRMKHLNAQGPQVFGTIPYLPALNANEFEVASQKPNTIVLDTREIEAFAGAHIPGALNIAQRKAFPIWAGRILDQLFQLSLEPALQEEHRLLLVAPDEQKATEAQIELLRIGYQNVVGYLRKGLRSWSESGKALTSLELLSVHELKKRIDEGDDLQLVDVRSASEWEEGRIPTAQHLFAADLPQTLEQLDPERPTVTYCSSGYRSSMAASILKRNYFATVFNVAGSMSAWRNAGYPLQQT